MNEWADAKCPPPYIPVLNCFGFVHSTTTASSSVSTTSHSGLEMPNRYEAHVLIFNCFACCYIFS